MRSLLLATGVAALALSAPTLAFGQGNGNRGGGGGHAERGGGGGGKAERGRGNGRIGNEGRGNRGGGREQREARGNGNGGGNGARQERRAERAERRQDRDASGAGDRQERSAERREVRQEARQNGRREGRRVERRAVQLAAGDQIVRLGASPDFVRGCPPGLAKRDNGCLPPGQARRIAEQRNWYDGWWGDPQSDARYRYDSGYLYRYEPSGGVAGFMPVLGGALGIGSIWPQSYQAAQVPDYYVDYFGAQQPYDYRVADNVVYGLDPQTDAIRQVVALVTGDDWSVGQRMPQGYDIYNLPGQYRDQYADTADRQFRYSDGHVYQVDPTTQLVQAAIQLIT